MDVSIVIPVFRSAATLPQLVSRLVTVLDDLGLTSEIVLVEDGGGDDSWTVLSQLRDQYPGRLVTVQLMRNYGQHNALMCGFRHSTGQIVVTMDDDLQNPPEEIPKLLACLQAHDADLVYGQYGEKQHHRFRNLGSSLVNGFYRYVFRTDVTVTSFRAIRRTLLEATFSYDRNFTFIDGLLAWNTQRISQCQVQHCPRAEGQSNYSISRLLTLALNLFTNFSLLPLQVISLTGFSVAGLGLLLAVYYLAQSLLSNIALPGYSSIIISVLVLGGVQLMALGVIGEYLGRLHLNVNSKPQYTVRQIAGRPAGAPASTTRIFREAA